MCASHEDAPAAAVPDQGSTPPADPALVADLVAANRILFAHGVVDAFGHVSVRHDKRPDRFLLARNMAPGQVTAADIVTFDLDGNPIDAGGRRVYLERFIHSEMYRARSDVQSVVHTHSASVVPFGLVPSVRLRPVWHMSAFIGAAEPAGAPVFEIRDVAGDATDLLITSPALGKALADCVGHGHLALMRGHGATVVGANLRLAVYRAVYAELNARLQAEALRLGPVTYLTEGESRTAMANVEGQVARAWDLWKSQAEAAMAGG